MATAVRGRRTQFMMMLEIPIARIDDKPWQVRFISTGRPFFNAIKPKEPAQTAQTRTARKSAFERSALPNPSATLRGVD